MGLRHLILSFFLLFPLSALICNKLEASVHDVDNIAKGGLNTVDHEQCAQDTESMDPIYACVTRVDRGDVQMGCLNRQDNESMSICEEAVENAKQVCTYNMWPYGVGHDKPGHGICCCPSHECNQPPPWWLLVSKGDEYDFLWRDDIDNLGIFFGIVTFSTILLALEALIQGKIWKFWKKHKKSQRKEQNSNSESDPFRVFHDENPDFPSNETSKMQQTEKPSRKVLKKPLELIPSGVLNATQSSSNRPSDLKLDITPKDSIPAVAGSYVLDKTQRETVIRAKSSILKKSPSSTNIRKKSSLQRKNNTDLKTPSDLAKKPPSDLGKKRASDVGKKPPSDLANVVKFSAVTRVPSRTSITDVTQQDNPDA